MRLSKKRSEMLLLEREEFIGRNSKMSLDNSLQHACLAITNEKEDDELISSAFVPAKRYNVLSLSEELITKTVTIFKPSFNNANLKQLIQRLISEFRKYTYLIK